MTDILQESVIHQQPKNLKIYSKHVKNKKGGYYRSAREEKRLEYQAKRGMKKGESV